jgi:hypothetical protein
MRVTLTVRETLLSFEAVINTIESLALVRGRSPHGTLPSTGCGSRGDDAIAGRICIGAALCTDMIPAC